MAAHKHAAVMLQYAEDAAENEQPWTLWEHRPLGHSADGAPEAIWVSLVSHARWESTYEYRRKPRVVYVARILDKTCMTGTIHEFPEPLRVEPAHWTEVFVPMPTSGGCQRFNWSGDDSTMLRYMRQGLLHLTKEAACLHALALISLTEQA